MTPSARARRYYSDQFPASHRTAARATSAIFGIGVIAVAQAERGPRYPTRPLLFRVFVDGTNQGPNASGRIAMDIERIDRTYPQTAVCGLFSVRFNFVLAEFG